jgi:hypothetical protein
MAITPTPRQSAIAAPPMPGSITCDATAPDTIVVAFPGTVDTSANTVTNYTVSQLTGPGSLLTGPGTPSPPPLTNSNASVQVDPSNTVAIIALNQNISTPLTLTVGQWIQVTVNVTIVGNPAPIQPPFNTAVTQVHDAGDAAGSTSQSVEDIAEFSVLTEEIGYPPSPLARPSGWGGAAAPAAGGMLGQTAMSAIGAVLGLKVQPDRMVDPKGFVGALNASFSLKQVEGHTEATWTPRTYAIQTDLSGGITGAQASVYQRAKDALDKSLPLLDGLYPLFKEAKDEDVAALRATVRSQFTDLVKELGLLGGPRISRITQLFSLLLGQQLPQNFSGVQAFLPTFKTDPDQISGSLGNLRVECGFGQADDQVNTVEDEQDVTNFRIVTDYVTSLALSWLNNLQFFGLGTPTPFFGTQLVLLSRQLSVIAESANEVRFTLDSVFIGPAERQTLQINFGSPAPANTPAMFLEDLLTWIDSFASEEGPRLIQDGGKFAVGESFVPIGTQLQTLVAGAVPGAGRPVNVLSLPRGYRTKRVRRSLEELRDQLQELVNLAAPISHVITPEAEPELALLGINPNVVFLSAWPAVGTAFQSIQVTIIGTGFDVGGTLIIVPSSTQLNFSTATILSDNLGVVTLQPLSSNILPLPGSYTVTITVTNLRNPTQPARLVTGFTVLA